MKEVSKLVQSSSISISRICKGFGIHPSSYYRWKRQQTNNPKTEMRKNMDASLVEKMGFIIETFPGYGYRRITKELCRQNLIINHKKVLRIMRENGLTCKRKKNYVRTTDSNHTYRIYPNLTKDLVLTKINQLWIADITYIRLNHKFIYLSVILDAFSRRCIGWSLSNNLESELATKALKQALSIRKLDNGLIHHSDRGVQYASNAYINLLNEHGIQISMSRRNNPYDNAKCESFMKTLKCEEVYLMEYEDEKDAYNRLKYFIEVVYNQKRLHSSIGYLTPKEFEESLGSENNLNKVVDFDLRIA